MCWILKFIKNVWLYGRVLRLCQQHLVEEINKSNELILYLFAQAKLTFKNTTKNSSVPLIKEPYWKNWVHSSSLRNIHTFLMLFNKQEHDKTPPLPTKMWTPCIDACNHQISINFEKLKTKTTCKFNRNSLNRQINRKTIFKFQKRNKNVLWVLNFSQRKNQNDEISIWKILVDVPLIALEGSLKMIPF